MALPGQAAMRPSRQPPVAWVASALVVLLLLTLAGPMRSMQGFGLFVLDWTAMSAVMMLPTAVPLLRRVSGLDQNAALRNALLCAAGFLAIWALAGAALRAFALLALPLLGLLGAAMALRILAVAMLAGGGAYLLSPLAMACAKACQSPTGFVARHWGRARPDWLSALAMGANYGVSCVGCCWPLMAAMALFAIHDPASMLGAALAMFWLKTAPPNSRLWRGLGIGLILLAALVAGGAVGLMPDPDVALAAVRRCGAIFG